MGQLSSRLSQLFPVTSSRSLRGNPEDIYLSIPSFGSYFANHFYLGGGRYENILPESFLFGEISDLNFLSSKSVPFPYPSAFAHEPTKALHAQINVRKNSIRLIKKESSNNKPTYNLEFIYDLEVPCAINFHFFCKEESTVDGLKYSSQRPDLTITPINCEPAKGKLFQCPQLVIEPMAHLKDSWSISATSFHKDSVIPFVINVSTQSENAEFQQQSTLCCLENYEGGHYIKVLKQKSVIDGVTYILQEIYGLENKGASFEEIMPSKPYQPPSAAGDNAEETAKDSTTDELVNSNNECVVCMCEAKDTLILPCRHLCLCADCARSLRYQSTNCPICRAPFRALLQLKGLHRSDEIPQEPDLSDVSPNSDTSIGDNTSIVNHLTEESVSRLLEGQNSDVDSVRVFACSNDNPEQDDDDTELDIPTGFKTFPIVSRLKPNNSSVSDNTEETSNYKPNTSRSNQNQEPTQMRKSVLSNSIELETFRVIKAHRSISQEVIATDGKGGRQITEGSTESSPSSGCNLLVDNRTSYSSHSSID